jgi:predicted patatin/cPLA2 family phospholipase
MHGRDMDGFGGNISEIADILQSRRATGSKPGERADGHHLALVVEGGGMRGVTSAGMVSALEELGLRDSIDSVHGSSAGAAAGAYFVSGQAAFGTRLYYEDLNSDAFIDTRRALIGKPILDTSFLVDHAMVERKPMNFPVLQSSNVPLHIVCTDVDKGEAYIVSKFHDYNYYRTALKASMTLPFIAGRAQQLDGRRLLDGGLLQQLAVASASAAGATHVLALLTRRVHELKRPEPTWRMRLEAKFLQLLYGGKMADTYLRRHPRINADVDTILSGGRGTQASVGFIALPHDIDYVHRLTKDGDLLRKAAMAASDHVKAIMRRN